MGWNGGFDVVLGNPRGAGKTSLIKNMLGKTFDPH
jgi:ABC-type Mn2+/Zn2+ transport system ATPase subunit